MNLFEFRIVAGDEGVSLDDGVEEGEVMADAAVAMNLLWLRRRPEMTCALTCGMIKYDTANKYFNSSTQMVRTGDALIGHGSGLCLEIAALDCAIRIYEGGNARPVILPLGDGVFHVVTESFDSRGHAARTDPSEELEKLGRVSSGRVNGCGC